eukprot:scaffold2127_cov85-Cylindrotheca_fusiformis.AAC.5
MAERISESANGGDGTSATSASDGSPHHSSDNNSEFEELFHSLILSGDTRASISQQLEECCDEGFMEYLSCSMMENSSDEEERQGLQELIHLIEQVQKEKEAAEHAQKIENDAKMAAAAANLKKQQQQQEENSKDRVPIMMSNADVLKEANAIDQAVMTAVMTDDEKPSDFISDCREVVNLSGGFNNHGRMRVGGR